MSEYKKPVVIVGFPGVGKSSLQSDSWVDLDLPGIPMELYLGSIRQAIHNRQMVMLPSWARLRGALNQAGIEYVAVIPNKELKEVYLERFRKRGSPAQMIDAVDRNWDTFIDSFEGEPSLATIVLEREDQYLADVLPEVLKHFK